MTCILCSQDEKSSPKMPKDVKYFLCSNCTQQALHFSQQDREVIYNSLNIGDRARHIRGLLER